MTPAPKCSGFMRVEKASPTESVQNKFSRFRHDMLNMSTAGGDPFLFIYFSIYILLLLIFANVGMFKN